MCYCFSSKSLGEICGEHYALTLGACRSNADGVFGAHTDALK